MVSRMAKGSVIVDVAIDQGGCVETCKPTTHEKPTYEVNGVIHYCVTNMPGAVSNTSTYALTNASLPYAKKFVEIGVEEAVLADPDLALGVNTYKGQVTHPAVANELGYTYVPIQSLLRKPGNGSGKKSSDPKKTNGKRSATRKVDVR
jgi:alanine dehydrogenase